MNIDSMTVEKRDGKNHGLKKPTDPKSSAFSVRLGEVVILASECKEEGFSDKVVQILENYAGCNLNFEMFNKLNMSWNDCVYFVKDDKCIEAALIAHKYVTQYIQAPTKVGRDFIDGDSGIGFYTRLIDRQKRALEKAFDCKWYFKARRPLQHLRDMVGEESALRLVNYAHPAHWTYPAGHGAKFAASFDAFDDAYELTANDLEMLFTFFFVLSCARSGGGVHFMEDNVASWSLVKGREIGDYKV